MHTLPETILELTETLCRLPGIGPRSAERLALSLALNRDGYNERLTKALQKVRETIQVCKNCGTITDKDHQPCVICVDEKRATGLICVVEKSTDALSLARADGFEGRFHVLGGKLSPLNGVEPEDLNIISLERRIPEENVQEIILALSSDVEGEATSQFLAQLFTRKGVKVSQLASGLPVGGGIEFADELTLSRALSGRREMETSG